MNEKENGNKCYSDRSLKVFLVITIVLSVIMETVMILMKAMGLATLLMWVPALAAGIANAISQKELYGKIGLKNWLHAGGFRIAHFKWILLACVVPALYIGISYGLFWILFPGSLNMDNTSVLRLIIMSVLGILIGVLTAIGEEIGWRGYFVPALLERVGLKKALLFTSLFWGVWHLPILISGMYMPGTPVWYKVPAFLLMIMPVGILCGLVSVKTRSLWPATFLHAAHNALDQTVFGPITVADNKMFYVSETGIFTIICAWVLVIILYKKLNRQEN